MVTIDVGSRIRDLRKTSGLTAEALAKKSDCSRSQLNAWEAGTYSPPFAQMEKIASALGVEVVELIAEEGESFQSVVQRVPEIFDQKELDVLKAFAQQLMEIKPAAQTAEHMPLLKAKFDEYHRRKQQEETVNVDSARADVPGLKRLSMTRKEAVDAIQWIALQMRYIPAELDIWPPLQKLSVALGHLLDPKYPDPQILISIQGANSASTNVLAGVTASKPGAESVEHPSTIPPKKSTLKTT